jgi:hypothetical protein
MLVMAVLMHVVGEDEAAATVLFGLTVMVPVAVADPQPIGVIV